MSIKDEALNLLLDDAYAASFQTMGAYRKVLIEAITTLALQEREAVAKVVDGVPVDWSIPRDYTGNLYTTPYPPRNVPWNGFILDDVCKAFEQVIEEHSDNAAPYGSTTIRNARIALRILRGFVPEMKRQAGFAYTAAQKGDV